MSFPDPMHYAVEMALEDGLAALDADALDRDKIPSAVIWSLKIRRAAIEAVLEREPSHPAAGKALAEFVRIARLLDALAIASPPSAPRTQP